MFVQNRRNLINWNSKIF